MRYLIQIKDVGRVLLLYPFCAAFVLHIKIAISYYKVTVFVCLILGTEISSIPLLLFHWFCIL